MFYSIQNQTVAGVDLYIYGDIVSEKTADWWTGEVSESDIDLKTFKECVDNLAAGQTLNMYFNSNGGSVFAASTMVSMLKRAQDRGVKVIAYIDGIAASAASFLAMQADEINVYKNSVLMVHKPLAGICGYFNAAELGKTIDSLNTIEDGVMIPLYLSKCKTDEEKLRNMISEETWLDSDSICENFNVIFNDDVKEIAACATSVLKNYKNIPRSVSFKAEQKQFEKPDYSDFENKIKNIKKEDMTYVRQHI